jgi:hypothetical protein
MDLGKIKQRQAQTKSTGDRFEVKEGANHIRLYAFSHKVTEADIKAGFFQKDKLGKVEKECDRAVTIHFGIGEQKRPMLSNKALMAKYETVLASQGEEVARKIGPQTKYAINVVDTDEKPRKMRHWMAPKSVYNKILVKLANEDYAKDGEFGELLLGSAGRDFTITYLPQAKGTLKYEVDVRDADKSPKMSADLQAQAKDFYSKDGFAVLGIIDQNAVAAPVDEDKEESEEKEEEKAEAASEEVAETAEEVEEVKPKAKAKKSPKRDEEEEDDD